jgi:hypothetical protein
MKNHTDTSQTVLIEKPVFVQLDQTGEQTIDGEAERIWTKNG